MADVCTASLGNEDLRLRPRVEIRRQHVLDDAHDFYDRVFAEPFRKQASEAPAGNGPPVREIGLRKRLVHQDRTDRGCHIVGAEYASFPQPHSQRLDIAGRDDRAERGGQLGPGQRRQVAIISQQTADVRAIIGTELSGVPSDAERISADAEHPRGA